MVCSPTDSPLPSLQVSLGSLTIHIEHSSQTRLRTLFERELTWALSSREIDAVARIHGRETFRRGEGSHRNYHLHPPPLPLLILIPLLLSLIGIEVYLIVSVTIALLYVDHNTLGSLLVTVNSRVSLKFVCRELVEAYRRDQAIQSEIERELKNPENQENIPPPAYVAPELLRSLPFRPYLRPYLRPYHYLPYPGIELPTSL